MVMKSARVIEKCNSFECYYCTAVIFEQILANRW